MPFDKMQKINLNPGSAEVRPDLSPSKCRDNDDLGPPPAHVAAVMEASKSCNATGPYMRWSSLFRCKA